VLISTRESTIVGLASCSLCHGVELGSGTGAVGLFAAGLGAKVILTDCRPPPDSVMYTMDGTSSLPQDGSGTILELLEKNVKANEDVVDTVLQVMELDWTNLNDTDHVAEKGEFDVVLASDVTHFSLMHEPLANTIARLLQPTGGLCLLSHQERMVNVKGHDMQLHDFSQVARSRGLHVENLPSISKIPQHGIVSNDNGGLQSTDTRISQGYQCYRYNVWILCLHRWLDLAAHDDDASD